MKPKLYFWWGHETFMEYCAGPRKLFGKSTISLQPPPGRITEYQNSLPFETEDLWLPFIGERR